MAYLLWVEPDDPFDFEAECEPENGVVHVESLGSDFTDFVVDERLKPHIRFDGDSCWLRDDESASLALELLRASRDGNVTLVRNDSSVGWIMEGLFG